MMSREHMRGTVCGVLLMATPLLLPLRALAQEEIGKTVSKEGDKEQSPEFRKEPTKDFQPVPLEQPVETRIRTLRSSCSGCGAAPVSLRHGT